MSKENIDPVDTLKQFMGAMRDWEEKFYKEQMELIKAGLDTGESEEKYKTVLADIFENFSIPDQRSWARLVDLGCGHPPTYDPNRDDIAPPVLSGKTHTIVVQQTARLKAIYKFYLKSIDGSYKIIKKETKNGDSWKKTAL
ncbi:NTF2 fold immunity protein [Pseudomonas syringae]|uniref:NTF2 fold immunity protein n=1 Tax=Pseudomonas syringae TaxID=317 RepID=UPI0004E6F7E5|nr:NTF2 fold immunity protein [Pseudomonas syringae]KFF85136.1 hypothetical protein HM80_03725 [Pseudomonas syringae pv. syringae]